MEGIELDAEQHRFFQEVYDEVNFSAESEKGCEGPTKLPALKAFQIFRSAHMPDEAINKVCLKV